MREAVEAFVAGLEPQPALRVTDVQTERLDVRGEPVPPCCPSFYFLKPMGANKG